MSDRAVVSTGPREHQLLVAAAKRWFLHPSYGVVECVDALPVDEAAHVGLAPLFIYAVNLAGTSVYWISYSAEPRPLQNVLAEAWRRGKHLRGPPDRVLVSRQVMTAAAPLKAGLAAHGIELMQVDPRDRRHPQCLRAVQDRRFPSALFEGRTWRRLEDLNRAAAEYHEFHSSGAPGRNAPPFPDRKAVRLDALTALDWTPGDWLWNYEATAPRGLQRCFHQGPDGHVTLLPGEARQLAIERRTFLDEYTPLRDRSKDECDRYWNPHQAPAEGVTLAAAGELHAAKSPKLEGELITYEALDAMLESWPNSAGELARAIGTTARALKSHEGLDGLDAETFDQLLEVLGYPDRYDQGCCGPAGGVVLIARGTAAITQCYLALTSGGDLEFALEVIPEGTGADPSFRYLLFKPNWRAPSVIMIPRGHRVGENLKKHFPNCESAPQPVSPAFYRELQRACARACLEPEANREEILAWAVRFEVQLEQMMPAR